MKRKYNEGFTLVELMVAMATGTIVFAAAATILLLGIRINNLTTGTTIRQNNTRTVLTVLERMATDGRITEVNSDGKTWSVKEEGRVIASYDSETMSLYLGESKINGIENEAQRIMDGVYASSIVLDEKGVLTIAVETEDGSYSSSVFCRTVANDIVAGVQEPDIDQIVTDLEGKPETDVQSQARADFLDVLSGQYRLRGGSPNKGLILVDGLSTGDFYTYWYIKNRHPEKENGESLSLGERLWIEGSWNKDTPWCACFVSWALSHENVAKYLTEPTYEDANGQIKDRICWYASVNEFADYLRGAQDSGRWEDARTYAKPLPGDLIFFDWLGKGNNLSHIGVVLKTEGEYVFTIEGNSAGMVAARMYKLSDQRIIGYGVMNWQ